MASPRPETPESIIQRDRKNHPECRYSSSISKACTTVDGNRSCETIRSILRSCPGVRPEQIYEDATRDGPSSSNVEDTPPLHPRLYRSDQSSRFPGSNGAASNGAFSMTPFEDFTGEFFAEIMRPFKGFLDEGFVQLPPFQGSAPDAANRPAAVPLKPRASTTTPDCPAPHKGSRENQKQSAKWQSGTVVEQA